MKENNKLLAEFLGWLVMECYVTPTDEAITSLKLNSEFKEIPPYTMKFHNDWNWLMLVVDKIESLGLGQRNFTVKISYDVCSIDFTSLHERRETPLIFKRSTDQRNKIEAVYNACVEFVEWLNKEEYQKAVMNSIDLE